VPMQFACRSTRVPRAVALPRKLLDAVVSPACADGVHLLKPNAACKEAHQDAAAWRSASPWSALTGRAASPQAC
jgi:hypothetical protein